MLPSRRPVALVRVHRCGSGRPSTKASRCGWPRSSRRRSSRRPAWCAPHAYLGVIYAHIYMLYMHACMRACLAVLYACMRACMRVCVHACVHVCLPGRVICTCVLVYMPACMCACACVCAECMCVGVCMCIHISVCECVCVCVVCECVRVQLHAIYTCVFDGWYT